MVICSQNKIVTWHFCSIWATQAKIPFFSPASAHWSQKRHIFLQKPAFLDSFLFHFKTYFAINCHFLAMESPFVVTRQLLTPKKGPF
jgi:hypothetical protein